MSITGLRCEASSSSHSSESSIGASQIRMRPLPEDVQPFKSFQSGSSILWEAMDSISGNGKFINEKLVSSKLFIINKRINLKLPKETVQLKTHQGYQLTTPGTILF